MEQLETMQLEGRHGGYIENGQPSSDSEQEDSLGTSRSGSSDSATPREELSLVTSPRANLLWDHGFDVANSERKSPEERDSEWRRFSNKTDDDKIIADKRIKNHEISHKLRETNDIEIIHIPIAGHGLPDLIRSASVQSSERSSQETLHAIDDLDHPPPLPDSEPPSVTAKEFPPPLPATSPPTLTLVEGNASKEIEETSHREEYENDKNKTDATSNFDTDSDDTDSDDTEDVQSDDSSSAGGDLPDRDSDLKDTNFEGFYNVQTHTVFRIDSDSQKPESQPEAIDDIEAEFDYILQSLNSNSQSQGTYIERFAGRRDRYGFILSPVIEAPSPTPSNMSGYSGYSGISCSSPDPLGVFRMSPGPSRGSKQELDLSSLCAKPTEWDMENEQTVPIYQTVHAKKVLIIPEGFGWESGDDLLSPTGSGEWDSYDNGLSTPPVATSSINLTQFGTHVTGWKQPDVAIYEEPENYNSDSTIENGDDSDTDTTLDDYSPRSNNIDISKVTVTECESPEKGVYQELAEQMENNRLCTDILGNYVPSTNGGVIDESIQTLELSVLDDGIKEIENELKLLKKHSGRNVDLIETAGAQELYAIESDAENIGMKTYEAANVNTVSLESNLDDSFRGFNEEIAKINEINELDITSGHPKLMLETDSINSGIERRCRKGFRVDSKQTVTTSDDESDTSEESNEDAEDEYSDSDNENVKEEKVEGDFDLFKAMPVTQKENTFIKEVDEQNDQDGVSVTELLSPRTAILLAGGMFPEETSSSSFSSDEGESQGNVTPDANMSSYGSGIKISQYTSGDSDDYSKGLKEKKERFENEKVNGQTANCVSFRKQMPEEKGETNIVTIHSPLDFSILDSKFESSKKGELRKSPKIFGRYYAEMDDKVLDEVRSMFDSETQSENPRSKPEVNETMTERLDTRISLFEQKATKDVENFENSFKNIEITDSSRNKPIEKQWATHNENCSDDNIMQSVPNSTGQSNAYTSDKDGILHKKTRKQLSTKTCVTATEVKNDKDAVVQNVSKCVDGLVILQKQTTPLNKIKPQTHKNEKHNTEQKKDNLNPTKPLVKKSPLLKLKIGNLTRRGSARSKVKHGYVHEISELFDKTQSECDFKNNKEKTSKKKPVKIERAQTPKNFTPNENMVIYEKTTTEPIDDNSNLKTQESLGFEVTPLERVTSFDDISSAEGRQKKSYEEDSEDFHYISDEIYSDLSDADCDKELKRYEDQLREIQTEGENNSDDFKGEPNTLDNIPHTNEGGTTEFVPQLHTSAEYSSSTQDGSFKGKLAEEISVHVNDSSGTSENYNKNVQDAAPEVIVEIIDGDTDPNQSEDEEFHNMYYLPGHSYHVNDTANRTDTAEVINKEPSPSINSDVFKRELTGAPKYKSEERVAVECSNKKQISKCVSSSQKGETVSENHMSNANDLGKCVNEECSKNFKSLENMSESGKQDICETKNTHSASQDSHIDMSSILWNIPWKTVKERKPKQSLEKSARSSTASTKKQTGYLYDLIARINMEPISKEMKTAKIEPKNEIINKSVVVDSDHVRKDSQVSLNVKDKISPSAVSEKGEFDFLDESWKKESRGRNTTLDRNFKTSRRNAWEYDDDPKFKIRYPSSLSRRLYGPYCRLRAKETVLQDENERETNPPALIHKNDSDRNMTEGNLFYTSCQRIEGLNRKFDNFSLLQKETGDNFKTLWENLHNTDAYSRDRILEVSADTQYPVSCYDTERPPDNLSIHSDNQNANPDNLNHTCYDVKTPFSSVTQSDDIKFNMGAIIGSGRNQAQQKLPVCENNFVNVNVQHERIEAERNTQKSDSSKTSYYSDKNCDVNFTNLPMHLKCNSEKNKHDKENNGEINYNNLGVDSNTVAVKNGDHQTTLGVRIPLELSTNETKQQNVDMNNDFVSTGHKLSAVKTNKAGINRSSASVTTQNIHSHSMSSGDAVTEVKTVSNGGNETPEADRTHISRASVVLQTPGFQHVLEDEKGKLRIWPYSDFDNSDKLPVTLHRVKKGVYSPVKKGMSSSSNKMTVIQSAERSAEMPDNRVVHKYQSSSILPADRSAGQIMKAHGESVQSVLLQDTNGNNVSEEEIASVLPKIAESISKMDNTNAEEILPGITQSITKLKNGGNLVITTMTRKLDEEESSSSGRGSPEPDYPVLNVDDLENSKIYLVQDSKGELFYVEDVTSESQESAYFSSRNTSESVSDTGNSPTFDRISKINSVGESGIKDSTAQEILTAMYGEDGVQELRENEEEWSERTYEYDFPRRRDSGPQREYNKDSFKTSYMVEEPGDSLPKLKNATAKDRYESSYQISGGSPWVYDGGMAQSYSQVTQGVYLDEANSVSAVSTQNVDNAGVRTIERYTIEGEAIEYPAPAPVFVPPMVVKSDVPNYSLVKVDVTPKHKDEGVMAQIEAPKPEEPVERPIFKTVAHIQTHEKVPSPKPLEKKKYKIIASKATEQEEEQETHMRFDEIDYKCSTENIEYTMKPATAETQYFVKNTTKLQPHSQFRSEKRIELGKSSDQKYKSEIQVHEPKRDVYEQSSYSYDQMKSELEQSESNMRVVRGSYLIKNTLDDSGTALDDNINMFDRNFTMCKDNPLYRSDEDLYRRLERERTENARRQERLQRDLNQDISFETVDRFSKSKTVKREPEKPRQSLYELLMSRLSTIDAKDIRQNIDVKHNAEDIYGDPRFLQADGEYLRNIAGTNEFETVGEKVDLMLKEGKAFITVKVTAERITPVDLEFNVWRKNQAIVTRTIEVDLLATEQRRRLYYKVMAEPAGGSHGGYRAGPNETVLDSKQTLELFTKILGAADGEGDTEDIEVKTRSGRTTRPFSSGMDLLY